MDTIPRYSMLVGFMLVGFMLVGGDWLGIPSTCLAGWTGAPPAPAQRARGLTTPATGMEISWTF